MKRSQSHISSVQSVSPQAHRVAPLASPLSPHPSRLALSRPVSEADSGLEKVAQWQSSMYGVDSGIQSRATTVRGDDGDRQYTMTTTTVTSEEPRESPRPFALLLRVGCCFVA